MIGWSLSLVSCQTNWARGFSDLRSGYGCTICPGFLYCVSIGPKYKSNHNDYFKKYPIKVLSGPCFRKTI